MKKRTTALSTAATEQTSAWRTANTAGEATYVTRSATVSKLALDPGGIATAVAVLLLVALLGSSMVGSVVMVLRNVEPEPYLGVALIVAWVLGPLLVWLALWMVGRRKRAVVVADGRVLRLVYPHFGGNGIHDVYFAAVRLADQLVKVPAPASAEQGDAWRAAAWPLLGRAQALLAQHRDAEGLRRMLQIQGATAKATRCRVREHVEQERSLAAYDQAVADVCAQVTQLSTVIADVLEAPVRAATARRERAWARSVSDSLLSAAQTPGPR